MSVVVVLYMVQQYKLDVLEEETHSLYRRLATTNVLYTPVDSVVRAWFITRKPVILENNSCSSPLLISCYLNFKKSWAECWPSVNDPQEGNLRIILWLACMFIERRNYGLAIKRKNRVCKNDWIELQ